MQFPSKSLSVALVASVLLVASCASEARNASKNLENPDPEVRIAAIEDILKLALAGEVSGWQQIQDKGCRDPEPRVRVAALQALGQFVEERPDEVVKKTLIGNWTYLVYVDVRILKTLRTDPSPDVRVAAAKFWTKANVLWEEGIKNLKEMLDNEKDEKVLSVAREALALRLERSLKNGDIKANEADQVREKYNLRNLYK